MPVKGNGLAVGLEAARRKAAIGTKAVFANVGPAKAIPSPPKGQPVMSQDAKAIKARQQYEDIPEARITRPGKGKAL